MAEVGIGFLEEYVGIAVYKNRDVKNGLGIEGVFGGIL